MLSDKNNEQRAARHSPHPPPRRARPGRTTRGGGLRRHRYGDGRRASATDLAAVGLGGSIYITIYISLMGVLQALAPIAGQLYGAGRTAEIGSEVRQAAWLGVALAVPGMLLLLFPGPLLTFAKAPPELVEKASHYLHIVAFGLPAALSFRIYMALNNALSRPIMVTVLQIAGLAMKVPLNAWFIHGGLGLAPMGGPGCALASTLISWTWCIAGLLILRTGAAYRPLALFAGWEWPNWSKIRPLLRLGVPMGLTYLIEITSFTLMSIFITTTRHRDAGRASDHRQSERGSVHDAALAGDCHVHAGGAVDRRA